MDDMQELKQTFFTECGELLADMEGRLLKLDEGTEDKEQLNAIFRCAHSIKGGAGAFGFDAIMHFTHALEALLDGMRDGKIVATRDIIDTLLKSADIVTRMLEAAQADQPLATGLGADILATLHHYTQGGAQKPAPQPQRQNTAAQERCYQISFVPREELFDSGNEPLLILRALSKFGIIETSIDTSRIAALGSFDPLRCVVSWTIRLRTHAPEEDIWEVFEFVSDLADIKVTADEAPSVAPEKAAEPPAKKNEQDGAVNLASPASATTSIRVDLEKVDRLVNMVGELVITEAMLRAQICHLPMEQFTGLQKGVDELSHHTRELQEAVMSVRMQPVKSIFSRMPRIVRDTSAQLGDPLTHMIRNSVDHGIETPDQRVWNDKPEQGTIHLSAYHRSGRIIIEIIDDGAGINRQRVLEKAREKGLIAQDAALSDEEVDHLIFLPGFSTAEKVTNVSGHDVGMDVVKRNIESLGGMVRITNQPGKGSTFTVSLPLTLAILDGMIVRVGQENYIIPITSIIETMRPKVDEIYRVEGRGDVINVRGEFVPLVYLHRIFGITGAQSDPRYNLIVLVESGSHKMGLVVDELIGQQQVVIKSLEANADPVKGISGATILGDGRVSLILEINELKSLCHVAAESPALKAA